MKTVAMISLGCPKNLVDAELMLGLLEENGYSIIRDPKIADILIVNTCSFIKDAKKESIDSILEMCQQKKESAKLVVTGCLPQRYKEELEELFPEVDLFVGTGEYQRIVELLANDKKKFFISTPQFIHNSKTPRKIATQKHAVYLKIAEGCFHGCSFCIIPKIRGKFRSRPIDDVVEEAKWLIGAGAKELNLIAQDTTAYGRDLKDGSTLAKLLLNLQKLEGEKWIRFLYSYPHSFTDELIEVISSSKDLCKYIDIPIQHISDKILKAMNRPGRGVDIRKLIEKIREKIPEVSLRTSVIVGFPGESKKDFNELLAFVKEGWFNNLGVFAYSKEEGTLASRMRLQVPEKEKQLRRGLIMESQIKISKVWNNSKLGKKVKVLVEGVDDAKNVYGRTEWQAPSIDGITYIKGKIRAKGGDFISAKVIEAKEYDLVVKREE